MAVVIFCACRCFCFFSGRRRHTRLQGDWSSDVCSSDLFESSLFSSWICNRGESRHFFSRSEEHTSELQSPCNLVCRLLLEQTRRRSRRGQRQKPFSAPRRRPRICAAT